VSYAFGFSTQGSGATDCIYAPQLTVAPTTITVFCWVNRAGAGGGGFGLPFGHTNLGGALNEDCWLWWDNASTRWEWNEDWTGSLANWSFAGGTTANVWTALGVSHASTATANLPLAYVNGLPQTVTTRTAASGTRVPNVEQWAIGSRLSDFATVFDGRVGMAAVWRRILTPREHRSLGLGVHPLVFSQGLMVLWDPNKGQAEQIGRKGMLINGQPLVKAGPSFRPQERVKRPAVRGKVMLVAPDDIVRSPIVVAAPPLPVVAMDDDLPSGAAPPAVFDEDPAPLIIVRPPPLALVSVTDEGFTSFPLDDDTPAPVVIARDARFVVTSIDDDFVAFSLDDDPAVTAVVYKTLAPIIIVPPDDDFPAIAFDVDDPVIAAIYKTLPPIVVAPDDDLPAPLIALAVDDPIITRVTLDLRSLIPAIDDEWMPPSPPPPPPPPPPPGPTPSGTGGGLFKFKGSLGGAGGAWPFLRQAIGPAVDPYTDSDEVAKPPVEPAKPPPRVIVQPVKRPTSQDAQSASGKKLPLGVLALLGIGVAAKVATTPPTPQAGGSAGGRAKSKARSNPAAIAEPGASPDHGQPHKTLSPLVLPSGVPETASLIPEMRQCGKPGCTRCPHGPYWYAHWTRGGKKYRRYVGKIDGLVYPKK